MEKEICKMTPKWSSSGQVGHCARSLCRVNWDFFWIYDLDFLLIRSELWTFHLQVMSNQQHNIMARESWLTSFALHFDQTRLFSPIFWWHSYLPSGSTPASSPRLGSMCFPAAIELLIIYLILWSCLFLVLFPTSVMSLVTMLPASLLWYSV